MLGMRSDAYPVRPGLTRKRCVGMIIIIATGDAGDA